MAETNTDPEDALAQLRHLQAVLLSHRDGRCPLCQRKLGSKDAYDGVHDRLVRRWSCKCSYAASCALPISRWKRQFTITWETRAVAALAKQNLMFRERGALGGVRTPAMRVGERRDPQKFEQPGFGGVRGKNVVMVGGEAREERRVALEEAFHCASLTWVPHNRPRLLQSLGERAAQGNVDIILVNKFVAHKETEALERATTVPIIGVRRGYGVTAVKTALEEYFGRRAASGA